MVKFVGGPSIGGYKSYINHTTAREGQWRMPRNYARPNLKVDIRNYNYCNCGSANTGFQLPAWLQWAQAGLNLLGGLFPGQPAPQPEVNPLQSQLDEMQKKIDELTKQNEELKKQPPVPPGGKEPPTIDTNDKPKVDPKDTDTKVDDKFDVSDEVEKVEETTKEEITTTTEAVVKKGRKRADGKVEYQGWKTLTASYGVPNTKEFRNWFRKEYLNGKDIWETGTQNFPTEIEYPKGSGTTYKFNGETFAKPIDLNENPGTGSVTMANMGKQTKTQETTNTKYRGSAKATWKGGSASETPEQLYKTETEARTAARTALRNNKNIPEQHKDKI